MNLATASPPRKLKPRHQSEPYSLRTMYASEWKNHHLLTLAALSGVSPHPEQNGFCGLRLHRYGDGAWAGDEELLELEAGLGVEPDPARELDQVREPDSDDVRGLEPDQLRVPDWEEGRELAPDQLRDAEPGELNPPRTFAFAGDADITGGADIAIVDAARDAARSDRLETFPGMLAVDELPVSLRGPRRSVDPCLELVVRLTVDSDGLAGVGVVDGADRSVVPVPAVRFVGC